MAINESHKLNTENSDIKKLLLSFFDKQSKQTIKPNRNIKQIFIELLKTYQSIEHCGVNENEVNEETLNTTMKKINAANTLLSSYVDTFSRHSELVLANLSPNELFAYAKFKNITNLDPKYNFFLLLDSVNKTASDLLQHQIIVAE